MSMTCDTVREWVQEDLDGELSLLHRTRLREHLADCPGCKADAERLRRLAQVLAADVVEVPRDFRHAVMVALPAAAWEVRRPSAWILAAVALVVVLLGGVGIALAAGELPGLGAVRALGDLIAETVVAGAGLAGASWRGLWLAAAELRQESPWTTVAMGLAVGALCVLLWRLVRGRPATRLRRAVPVPERSSRPPAQS